MRRALQARRLSDGSCIVSTLRRGCGEGSYRSKGLRVAEHMNSIIET
ncbi:MAG: hypothetical protein QXI59_06430 [Candidatus Bathyarchaeia archaeon]